MGKMGKYLSRTYDGNDKFWGAVDIRKYRGLVGVGLGRDKGERGKGNQFNLFKGHRNKNYSRK